MLHQLEIKFNEVESVLCTVKLNGVLEKDKRDGYKSIARQLCQFLDVKFVQHLSAEQNIKFLNVALAKMHA